MVILQKLSNIGIHHGLKGYKQNNSTFSHQTGVEDLSMIDVLFLSLILVTSANITSLKVK